jgi:hypothetical protein
MSPLPRKRKNAKAKVAKSIQLGLALVLLGSCTSPDIKPTPEQRLVMGDRICGGEGTQIYFANQDDVLSPSADQVLSKLSDSLIRCPSRRILLYPVSGDDGAAAFPSVAEQRLYRVRATLLQHGLSEDRFDFEPALGLNIRLPSGPIGGVIVLTRRLGIRIQLTLMAYARVVST